MPKTIIDLTGSGGLAPQHQGDRHKSASEPNLRYVGADNQTAQGTYNPMRRVGYLSPATSSFAAVTAASGSFGTHFQSSVYDSHNNGEDIYFGDTDKIWRADGMADLTLTTAITGITDTGPGNSVAVVDMVVYTLNSNRTLYYLWAGASTVGDVGTHDIGAGTSNHDFFSTDADGDNTTNVSGGINIPSFLRLSDNGLLYVFENGTNGAVHSIDGTDTGGANGTVQMNLLEFPNGVKIRDAIDYRGNMYMAIEQENTMADANNYASPFGGIYVWDRLSQVISRNDFFPYGGIRNVIKFYIAPDGDLRMLCIGGNRMLQVRRFTGANFEVLAEAGINARPEISNGVTVTSNGVVWVGTDGKQYFHGKISEVIPQEGIFQLGNLFTSVTGFNAGTLIYGGSTSSGTPTGSRTDVESFYIAYDDNSTPKVALWAPYASADSVFTQTLDQGDVYSLVKFMPVLSNVNYIDLYMAPTTTGSTVIGTVKVYLNQSTTPFKTLNITLDIASKGYHQIPIHKQYVNAVQVEVEWSTSRTLGANDFTPSVAVVDYTDVGAYQN